MSDTLVLHALFGGTFDPIHFGHLQPVAALANEVGLQQVTLLPNNVPPHRPQPEASPAQRVEMVKLAIRDLPLFTLDTRELQRNTPSYTVDTLEEWREQYGTQQPLAFIIGQDSLLTLHQWHRWQDLLSLCHLLVLKRPGYAVTLAHPYQQQWLESHLAQNITQLHHTPAGYIWLATTPMVNISATEIRTRHRADENCNHLLPRAVLDYIDHQGLYRGA